MQIYIKNWRTRTFPYFIWIYICKIQKIAVFLYSKKLNMKKRIEHIDILKAFAIFCVVLGHTLQYGFNYVDSGFYGNQFWAFIYSFHMPLFMMLSGFFAASSLHSSFLNMLKSKILRIWLPAYLWLTIALGACLILSMLSNLKISEIPNFFPPLYDVFWYLNSLIFCYIIFFISKKLIKKDILACTLSCLLLIILPIGYIDNLNFMLPYFWIGYFIHKYDHWLSKHLRMIIIISFIGFVLLSFLWSGRYTVYKYPIALYPLPSASYLAVIAVRYSIGLLGALFFWTMAVWIIAKKYIFKCSIFTHCGQYTLAIYIINVICCEIYSRSPLQIYHYNGHLFLYNIASIIFSTIFITLIMFLISIIQKNSFTRHYLLGKP